MSFTFSENYKFPDLVLYTCFIVYRNNIKYVFQIPFTEYDFGHGRSTTFSHADNIVVNITDETMNRTHECGGKYPGPTGNRDVILFLCPPGTRGNSITVKKIKISFLMNLCEVEAYGHM